MISFYQEPLLQTNALNVREAPARRGSDAQIAEFTIERDDAGRRLWIVRVS